MLKSGIGSTFGQAPRWYVCPSTPNLKSPKETTSKNQNIAKFFCCDLDAKQQQTILN